MNLLKQTGIEIVVLGLIGLVLALAANAVRAKGSITIGKNYFYVPDARAHQTPDHDAPSPGSVDPTHAAGTAPAVAAGPADAHADHPYQPITYAEVVALLDDPDTEAGLNVLIDSRNDHDYEDGHLPGAVQCDPYEVARYWDDVEPLVLGALKVVVYCGGGECEDSIFMARELVEQGVPFEAVYLYAGGWEDWKAQGGPFETGRTE